MAPSHEPALQKGKHHGILFGFVQVKLFAFDFSTWNKRFLLLLSDQKYTYWWFYEELKTLWQLELFLHWLPKTSDPSRQKEVKLNSQIDQCNHEILSWHQSDQGTGNLAILPFYWMCRPTCKNSSAWTHALICCLKS